jgi:hypothetical protein
MNYTTLFYWLTVADNARSMFSIGILIFTAIAVISTVANFILRGNEDEDADTARRWM